MSVNTVLLVGNLTRDVELNHVGTKKTSVAKLGLAVNESVKRGDEYVEEPVFVDVTLWGRVAEVAAEFLRKGSQVLIEGRLKLDRWEKDGQKFSKLSVVGNKMQILSKKNSGSPTPSSDASADGSTPSESETPVANIPF